MKTHIIVKSIHSSFHSESKIRFNGLLTGIIFKNVLKIIFDVENLFC